MLKIWISNKHSTIAQLIKNKFKEVELLNPQDYGSNNPKTSAFAIRIKHEHSRSCNHPGGDGSHLLENHFSDGTI